MAVSQMSESQVQRLCRSMEDQGVDVTRTTKGLFLRLPNGDSTTIHFTNSDVRATANVIARLRRAGVRHPDDSRAVDELPKQITESGMPAPKTKQKILNGIVDLGFPEKVKVKDMIETTGMEHVTISRALFHMGFRPILGKRNSRDWLTPAEILEQRPTEDVVEESPTVPEPEPIAFDPPLTEQEADDFQAAMSAGDLEFLDTRDSWTVDMEELMGGAWPIVKDRLRMLNVLGMDYEFRVWRTR